MAELIRRSVDGLLSAKAVPAARVSRAGALRVIGFGGSGAKDVSARHDEYLLQAYLGVSTDDGPDARERDCAREPDETTQRGSQHV